MFQNGGEFSDHRSIAIVLAGSKNMVFLQILNDCRLKSLQLFLFAHPRFERLAF